MSFDNITFDDPTVDTEEDKGYEEVSLDNVTFETPPDKPAPIEEPTQEAASAPLSMSRVDVMLSDPQAMESFLSDEASRKQLREQRQEAEALGAVESGDVGYRGVEITSQYEPFYTEEEQAKSISIDELAASPKFVKLASDYLTKRVGPEVGNVDNYDNTTDFVERYMEHTRAVAANSVSAAKELGYIRGLDDKGKAELAKLYSLTEHISSATEAGGDALWNAVSDYAYYGIGDPLNVVTGLGGFAVNQGLKMTLGKAAFNQAVRSQVPRMVVSAGVDGTLAMWDNANRQSINVELGMQDDFDIVQLALATTLGVGASLGVDTLAAKQAIKSGSAADKLNARLGIDPVAAAEEAARIRKKKLEKFDPEIGRKVREDLQRGDLWSATNTADKRVVEPHLNQETYDNVLFAVEDWVSKNPQIAAQMREEGGKRMRITDFVVQAIRAEDDEAVDLAKSLQEALDGAGVTSEQFSHAFGGSVSDAARTLGKMSAFRKSMDKLTYDSPTLAKALDRMYKTEVQGVGHKVLGFGQSVDRGLKALLTSAPMTTMRNIIGNSAHLTLDVASDALESAIYHAQRATGRTFQQDAGKNAVRPMREILADSFAIIGRLGKQAEQQEILERILKNNQGIEARLMQTVTDATDDEAIKATSGFMKSLQYFNRLQDGFFRRAIFNNRVDYYLRRTGNGNLDEFLKQGKPIPKDILLKASEDALERTFGKQYRIKKTGGSTDIEGHVNNIAAAAIKVAESVPIVFSAAIPFPRYMANAMEFMYKYNPLSQTFLGATGTAKSVFSKEMDEASVNIARERLAKGVVGGSLLLAMYQMRSEQPDDAQWNEYINNAGEVADYSTIGPIAVFGMFGDIAYRMKNGKELNYTNKDLMEAITGLRLTGSTDSYNILGLANALSNPEDPTAKAKFDTEKLANELGFVLGDVAGRAAQPLRTVSDIFSAFDAEEAVVRDIKQQPIDAGFTETFTSAVQKRIPLWKQELPAYVSATRTEKLVQRAPFASLFLGTSISAPRTPVEQELYKANIKPWSIVPYSKDKKAQALIAQAMAPWVSGFVNDFVQSEDFQNKTQAAKTIALQTKMSEVKEIAAPIAESFAQDLKNNGEESVNRYHRHMWLSLPKVVRIRVNELRKEDGLNSIEGSNDYLIGIGLAAGVKEGL